MLEIPEIERARRSMDKQWVGQQISGVFVQRESWIGMPLTQLIEGIVGKQLLYVERRGKALIFHLDDGRRLLLQIGFGGNLSIERSAAEDSADTSETITVEGAKPLSEKAEEERVIKPQLELFFEQGSLVITGARSLTLQWITAKELDDQLKKWGPDPLSRHLTAKTFQHRFSKRRTALKTALSNPELIAGLTPVTVDEICYRAGIVPFAKTEQLTTADWESIYEAMVAWLLEAIEQSEEVNYVLNGQGGEGCSRCNGKITEHAIGGKAALYCSGCQDEHARAPKDEVRR